MDSGTVLLEPGHKTFDGFGILSGCLTITDPFRDNALITHHGPGEFSGDSDILSQRACVVRGEMTQAGEVIRLSAQKVRALIAE